MKKRNLFIILFMSLFIVFSFLACSQDVLTVTFYVDGVPYKSYKVETGGYLDEVPNVPEKEGYKGSWSVQDFEEINTDLRVDAIYTKSLYTVSFYSEGQVIYSEKVQSGKSVSEIPLVPEKEGYTGEWNISPSDLSGILSDIEVKAVYTLKPITVTFYKNSFVYTASTVKVGDEVPERTYYEVDGENYVLTEDKTFRQGVFYYTRTREVFSVIHAVNGVLEYSLPTPPAQEGVSVKWMQIKTTASGEKFVTPDFSVISADMAVVAYPYVTVTLIDSESQNVQSSFSVDMGETISSVQQLSANTAEKEFFGWYTDIACTKKVSFPCSFDENTTLYAKWISLKGTEGLIFLNGAVTGYSGTERAIDVPVKYTYTENGEQKTRYVTTVASDAFKGLSVTSVSLPASVTAIGDNAFYNCSELTTVLFPDGNYVETYGNQAFRGCGKLTAFAFSAQTSTIGRSCFTGCEKMEKVSGLEGSLLSLIARYAFSGCVLLKNLSLPASVTVIEEYAFSGDKNLTVTFADENNLQVVGDYAFQGCQNFAGFSSSAIRLTGKGVYAGCSALTTATVYGKTKVPELFGKDLPEDYENFYVVFMDGSNYYLPKTLSDLTLSLSGEEIPSYLLYDCYSVKNVTFIGTPKVVCEGAFMLEHYTPDSRPFSITLPDSIITIEKNAFKTRVDLRSITIPSAVTSIGEYAFYDLSNLVTVSIDTKNSLVSVGKYAFSGTKWVKDYKGIIGLGKVVIGISEDYCRSMSVGELSAKDFSAFSVIAPHAFENNTVLKKITLSDSIYKIGDNAFYGCEVLTTFAFGCVSTSIDRDLGQNILENCSQLQDLTLCEDIVIGELFEDGIIPQKITCLRLLYAGRNTILKKEKSASEQNISVFACQDIKNTKISALYIGEGFVTIGEESFAGCANLAEVYLGSQVKTIGEKAFLGCTALKTMEGKDSSLEIIGKSAFFGCNLLSNLTLPGSVKNVEEEAFYGTAIKSFNAPSALMQIGTYAFYDSGLEKITLGEGIRFIGKGAFENCNLTEIVLPSTLSFEGMNGKNSWCVSDYSPTEGITYVDNSAFGTLLQKGDLCVKSDLQNHGERWTKVKDGVNEAVDNLSSLWTNVLGTYPWCSEKTTRLTAENMVRTEYCDCNPFGIILKNLGGTEGLHSREDMEISESMAESMDDLTEKFSNRTVNSVAFFNQAKYVFDHSENNDVNSLSYTSGNTLLIELTNATSEEAGKLAKLFGYTNGATFTAYAKKLVQYLKTNEAGACTENRLVYNGAIYTENGTYVLPFAFTSDFAETVLMLVFVENGNMYFWLNNRDAVDEMIRYGQEAGATYHTVTVYARCMLFESLRSFALQEGEKEDFENLLSASSRLFSFAGLSDSAFRAEKSLLLGINKKFIYGLQGNENVKNYEECLEAIASLFGYASVESFLQSMEKLTDILQNDFDFSTATASGRLLCDGVIYAEDGSKSIPFAIESTETILGCFILDTENTLGLCINGLFEKKAEDSVKIYGRCLFETQYTSGYGILNGNSDFTSLTYSGEIPVDFLFAGKDNIPFPFSAVTVTGTRLVDYALYGVSLKTVTLSSSVKEIGDYALAYCTALKEIIIPAEVERLGEGVFYHCTAMTSCRLITKDSRLVKVGNKLFEGCSSLLIVHFPDTVQEGEWKNMFKDCVCLTSVNLPLPINVIGEKAYYGCSSLEEITLHDGIVYVGEEAFLGCGLLELNDVDFTAVTYIGNRAFAGCTKLHNVRAENAEEIGENAFLGCTSVTEITVRDQKIAYYTDRTELTSVNIAYGVASVPATFLDGVTSLEMVIIYSQNENFTVETLANSTPAGTKIFLNEALYSMAKQRISSFNNIYVKPSLSIFEYAFDTKTGTATIVSMEFDGEESLDMQKMVYVPEICFDEDGKEYTVTKIGDNAFLNKAITYAVIPASIEEIGDAAFSKTTLQGIMFESGSKCALIGNNAFKDSEIISITIPNAVREIGSQAFSGCKELKEVKFLTGSLLAKIGSSAFENTDSLLSLTFTGPLSEIGTACFASSGITSVDFGTKATLKIISAFAFNGTHLTHLVLPQSVEEIGESAFYGYAGTTLVLPCGVKTIGKKAFSQATSLQSVTFTAGEILLSAIGNEAFRGNTMLTEAELPDSVTEIGEKAFYGCSSVRILTIGKNVKTIGKEAFSNMSKVTKLNYKPIACDDLTEGNFVFYGLGTTSGVTVEIMGCVQSIPTNLFYPSSQVSDSQGMPNIIAVRFADLPVCEKIGENAFRLTEGSSVSGALTQVVLPSTLLTIGNNIFCGRNITVLCEQSRAGERWATDWSTDCSVQYACNNRIAGDFTYTVHGDKAFITDYTGSAEDVTVPSRLDGKDVYSLGTTFEKTSARFIYLPDTLSLLGSFSGSENLVGVQMQNGVKEIAENCFKNCTSLLYFIVPQTIAKIGKDAFSGCSALGTVFVESPYVVEEIEKNGSTYTLETIAGGLFVRAESIYMKKTLNFSDIGEMYEKATIKRNYHYIIDREGYSVYTTLYWKASEATRFAYVYLLNDWMPEDESAKITKRYNLVADGTGYMKEFSAYEYVDWKNYVDYIVTITVGENIKSVGKYSFAGMKNVSQVYFNASDCEDASENKFSFLDAGIDGFTLTVGSYVGRIPAFLFTDCVTLKNIIWQSQRLETIASFAFENCLSLTEIVLPDTVTTVGTCAFYGCYGVQTITIGQNMTTFGSNAFTNVGFNGSNFVLKTIYYNAVQASNLSGNLSVFSNSYLLRAGDKPADLVVGNNVTSLPDYLFFGCNHIGTVTFGKSPKLTLLGDHLFDSCTALSAIDIPSSVTEIGESCFASSTMLSQINFSANNAISVIRKNAFYNTAFYENADNWTENVLYLYGKAFLLDAKLTVAEDYSVHANTILIAENAFEKAINLAYVHIPSAVRTINDGAFESCTELKTIYISGKTVIGNLLSKESQGGLLGNAKNIYLLATQVREESVIGYYVKDNYHLVEKDTIMGENRYYSYTTLYWESGAEGGSVYTYLLNDEDNKGAYYMTIEGSGAMADYASMSEVPWQSYRNKITALNVGKEVTGLGKLAFASFSILQKINYLSNTGVKMIGESAFYGCIGLTDITIPKGVTYIGNNAFNGCSKIEKITYNAISCNDLENENGAFSLVGSLTENGVTVEISLDTQVVPSYLFCPSLNSEGYTPRIVSVKFLGGVGNRCVSVRDYAFAKLTYMTDITMDGLYLEMIGNGAFMSCVSLTDIGIPTGVTSLGKQIYKDCTGLTSVTYSAQNNKETPEGEDSVFIGAGSPIKGLTLYLTDKVQELPSYFFDGAENLIAVEFPAEGSLEKVGRYAFRNCVSLKTIGLPETLNTIDEGAFYGCTALTKMVLPFVGGNAKSVEGSASSLFGYLFGTGANPINGMSQVKQYYSDSGYVTYYIPDSLHTVEITTYTNLYYGAFYGCSHLSSITVDVSDIVTYEVEQTDSSGEITKKTYQNGYLIGSKAFFQCTGLTRIELTERMTEIGAMAFSECSSLSVINIPKNITFIGQKAFSECVKLTTVQYDSASCADFASGDNVFENVGTLQSETKLVIGANVTKIPAYFFGCEFAKNEEEKYPNLSKIENKSTSIKTIGENAFASCAKLSEVSLPDGVQSIGSYAFSDTSFYKNKDNWTNSGILYLNGYVIGYNTAYSSLPESCYIDEGTKLIADSVFASVNTLRSLTLPLSVAYIGKYAFKNCINLQTISYSVSEGLNEGSLVSIGNGAFYNCYSLTSFTVTGQVTSIGEEAFTSCSSLKEVTLYSEEICKIIANQNSAGSLCTKADTINVYNRIPTESIGSYLRTGGFNKTASGVFNVYKSKK